MREGPLGKNSGASRKAAQALREIDESIGFLMMFGGRRGGNRQSRMLFSRSSGRAGDRDGDLRGLGQFKALHPGHGVSVMTRLNLARINAEVSSALGAVPRGEDAVTQLTEMLLHHAEDGHSVIHDEQHSRRPGAGGSGLEPEPPRVGRARKMEG